MKLYVKGRQIEDIVISGKYPDQMVDSASYVDTGDEVEDEDLATIDSDELGMFIAERY